MRIRKESSFCLQKRTGQTLGERRVFQILLQYLAKYHPQDVIANLDLIGVYGRFDDWYCLVGTRVENEMWKAMKQ